MCEHPACVREIDCLAVTCNKKPLACLAHLGNVFLIRRLLSGQLALSWVTSLQIVQASAPELTRACQVTSTGKVESSGKKGEISVMGRRISNHVATDLLERKCLLWCHPEKLKGTQHYCVYGIASFPELELGLGTWPVLIVLKKPGNSFLPFPETNPGSSCKSVVCALHFWAGKGCGVSALWDNQFQNNTSVKLPHSLFSTSFQPSFQGKWANLLKVGREWDYKVQVLSDGAYFTVCVLCVLCGFTEAITEVN